MTVRAPEGAAVDEHEAKVNTRSGWTIWLTSSLSECHACSALVKDDDLARRNHEKWHENVVVRDARATGGAVTDSERLICGMVAPYAGPHGEPVACGWKPDHLPDPHSWAWIPTYTVGAETSIEPQIRRDLLAAWLVGNGYADAEPGYGHVTGTALADALLAEFDIRIGPDQP